MSAATMTHRMVHLDGSGCDLREVGGKAAGLDRLAAHGFTIPKSFAVPVSAYREAIALAGLEPWIAELAGRPSPAPQDLAADIAEVEDTFRAIRMDRHLADSIGEVATQLLESGRVAVRSSATAEDLSAASFAGQYRTFTRLDALEDILDAVKACWASLWLPSAREYRLRHQIQPSDLAMAVVIQSLVEADWSGVAFTTDPGTDLAVMRVEVVPGLGESLVSGLVTPLDFSIRRDTLEISSRGGDTAPAFLEDLARMMLQVEHQLDEPQDVEWAVVDAEITLLQARPITVVGPRALLDDGFDQPLRSEDEFTPHGVVEMLPGTIDPLLWTINAPMIEHGYRTVIADLGGHPGDPRRPYIGRFRGRPALNLSELRDIATEMPGGSAGEVEQQFLGRPLSGTAPPTRRAGLLDMWRSRSARYRLAEEIELGASASDAIVGFDLDLGALPARRLVGYQHAVRDLAWRIVAAEVAASNAAAVSFRSLELLLQRWLGEDEAATWAQTLTVGTLGRHAAGARLDRDLHQAYRRAIAADPRVADAIGSMPEHMSDRMEAFGPVGQQLVTDVAIASRMAGSRALFGGASWDEEPEVVWRRLAALAEPSTRARGGEGHGVPLDDLAVHLQSRRGWRTIRILTGQIVDLRLRWIARQADEAAGALAMRERAKSALLTLGGEQRRIIVEAASRLVASHQIDRIDEVAFLSDGELGAMLLGAPPPPAATMRWRKATARRAGSAPALPEVFAGSPGFAAAGTEAGRSLKGWPASSGRVTAPARVIHDIVEANRMHRGDVLVTASTDPGWTPVILDAGAIVLETGGPLSHAALVAREFGIPAVLRVTGATTVIRDGEPLDVDGYAGIVTRLDSEEAKSL